MGGHLDEPGVVRLILYPRNNSPRSLVPRLFLDEEHVDGPRTRTMTRPAGVGERYREHSKGPCKVPLTAGTSTVAVTFWGHLRVCAGRPLALELPEVFEWWPRYMPQYMTVLWAFRRRVSRARWKGGTPRGASVLTQSFLGCSGMGSGDARDENESLRLRRRSSQPQDEHFFCVLRLLFSKDERRCPVTILPSCPLYLLTNFSREKTMPGKREGRRKFLCWDTGFCDLRGQFKSGSRGAWGSTHVLAHTSLGVLFPRIP